jgi:hypothetical protein
MKRFLLLVLLNCACTVIASAEVHLGTVRSIIGNVSVDTFGKGAFIPAAKGDDLFGSTVLKTGANGQAILDIDGRVIDLPPEATVKIAELVAASQKKGGLQWFAAIGKLVKSFATASKSKEGDLVLGTRAAEVNSSESAEMEWAIDETEATVLIPQARKSICCGPRNAGKS